MIVERTRMGLARKASKGKWTGGTPPFGYLYDSERRVLVPAEEEAALVGRIFSLYADRRWGSAAISRWPHETCRTTRRRSRWTPKTVLDVLRNPTYVGQLPFRGSVHQAGHDPITDSGLFERAGPAEGAGRELPAASRQQHDVPPDEPHAMRTMRPRLRGNGRPRQGGYDVPLLQVLCSAAPWDGPLRPGADPRGCPGAGHRAGGPRCARRRLDLRGGRPAGAEKLARRSPRDRARAPSHHEAHRAAQASTRPLPASVRGRPTLRGLVRPPGPGDRG